jgi:mono/diheme cytochrome c family protein
MKIAVIVSCVSLFLIAACGSARRSEPIRGPMDLSSTDVHAGMKVFMKRCYQCHPGGEGGLGPAINNKPLPEKLIKFQIRKGIGSMPSFSQSEIPDDLLDQLMDYIKALRKHKVSK